MPEYYCYLVTLWCEEADALIRCALKADFYYADLFDQKVRECVRAMLPDHVARCRKVVEIERIFEVHDVTA